MTARRLTLPQQRAQETRDRILDAGALVFARRGYGQATVQDIADEAEISMGALYHHFSGKEELFRAIVEDHVRRELIEYEPQPAASAREAIEHFVTFMIEHLRKDPPARGLAMELWAQGSREQWAREVCIASFRVFRDLLGRLLGIAQEAGIARRDIDVESTAILIEAMFAGMEVQWALEPDLGGEDRLARTWADLLERFIRSDDEGDVQALDAGVSQMFEELRRDDVPPATPA
jgi:AcrR family transcriptional regulator